MPQEHGGGDGGEERGQVVAVREVTGEFDREALGLPLPMALFSMVGVIVTLLAYPLAVFGARWRLDRFAQAAVPPQAVAISTQSSLACLPPMLRAAERLRPGSPAGRRPGGRSGGRGRGVAA